MTAFRSSLVAFCALVLLTHLSLFSARASAEVTGHAPGLPTESIPADQLYQYNYTDSKFEPVPEGKAQPHFLYIKYNTARNRWTWVSGDDFRPIATPTKVQGFRLGMAVGTENYLNWFQLLTGDVSWKMSTENTRPREHRYTDQGRTVVAWTAPELWTEWGGKIDGVVAKAKKEPKPAATPKEETPSAETPKVEAPKTDAPKVESPKAEALKTEAPKTEVPKTETPKPKIPAEETPLAKVPKADVPKDKPVASPKPISPAPPGCTLTVSPSPVTLGNRVKLTLVVRGDATKATLNGKPAKIPNDEASLKPLREGTFTVSATVEGPGGKTSCWAEFHVDAAVALPDPDKNSCSITLDPPTVKLGESTLATMEVAGEFKDATLDGVHLLGPTGIHSITPTKAGKVRITGEVDGEKNKANCYADLVVEP